MNNKPRPICANCKHASKPFKVSNRTHHHCHHTKWNAGMLDGSLSQWETFMSWYETCEDHEFKNK